MRQIRTWAYRKYEETHYKERILLEEMKELIRKSGLEFVTAYDAFSKNAPMDTSERIYVIAKRTGKVEQERIVI